MSQEESIGAERERDRREKEKDREGERNCFIFL